MYLLVIACSTVLSRDSFVLFYFCETPSDLIPSIHVDVYGIAIRYNLPIVIFAHLCVFSILCRLEKARIEIDRDRE